MISRTFKQDISRFTHPAAVFLKNAGVSPNQMTLAGFILGLLAAGLYAGGSIRLGGLVLLLSGLFDVLDGSLARNTGTESRFGAFLDSVADRYSEFFVFLGILYRFHAAGDTSGVLLLYAALLGSVMVSYSRARAESIIPKCEVGLMERPERVIILIVFSLLDLVRAALWILAIGANLTALHRIAYTRREIKRAERP